MELVDQVREAVRRDNLFSPGEKILAAVSGGPDSLALLLVLLELNIDTVVAHFDHRLRPESGEDAEYVRQMAASRGIAFVVRQGDVRTQAHETRKSLEETARVLRYAFLSQAAEERGIGKIALGHTADDQAETVLMHLIRGAGPSGMRGMLPVTDLHSIMPSKKPGNIQVVRPLLTIPRSEIEKYCASKSLVPLRDPSNTDTRYWRNRIRHQLVPLLKTYNGKIVEKICSLSEITARQVDFIEQIADSIFRRSVALADSGRVEIENTLFTNEHTAIQGVLVRKIFQHLIPGCRDLAERHIRQVIRFAQSPASSLRSEVALGVEIRRVGDRLVFLETRRVARLPDWNHLELPNPGRCEIHSPDWRWEVTIEQAITLQEIRTNRDPYIVWMDPAKLIFPLRLRRRQAGDRFHPFGFNVEINLSNFLAAHGMPAEQRERWPLVCDEDGIVWVPGFRQSQSTLLEEGTKEALRIRVHVRSGTG